MVFDFAKLCDWELKRGSHDWPGPDGGTCINEAAIIAAGFEYKSVRHVLDLPPCFSRTLAGNLLTLNDKFSDKNRQLLKPFVVRLAGSADSSDVEYRRQKFIENAWASVFGFAHPLPRPWSRVLMNKHPEMCIRIMEGAFTIGNQARDEDVQVVVERLEKAKRDDPDAERYCIRSRRTILHRHMS